MVGHQTVTINGQRETLRRLGQKGQKHPTVVIYKEDVLVIIAPLGYMMSTTFDYNSWTSWHNVTITDY